MLLTLTCGDHPDVTQDPVQPKQKDESLFKPKVPGKFDRIETQKQRNDNEEKILILKRDYY